MQLRHDLAAKWADVNQEVPGAHESGALIEGAKG